MADEARAKRAAALEEKKRRLEQLKARRSERAATAAGGATTGTGTPSRSGAGGNLDEYIDGLLKSEAPPVPGVGQEVGTAAPPAASEGSGQPRAEDEVQPSSEGLDGATSAETKASASAPASAQGPTPAPARKVETFTMATQTEEDDFPPPLEDEDEDDDEDAAAAKAEREAEALAAAAAGAGAGAGEGGTEQEGEKGTQTLPLPPKLDPSSVTETISSRPFVAFLNSASKKVERVLGAPALAELLDDPAYDDDDEEEEEGDGAGGGESGVEGGGGGGGGGKRARRTKKGQLGTTRTGSDTLDATGIIQSSQTYTCPRWTDHRDITSITWSPHRREMLVASYQSSSSSSSSATAAGVDAAVRAVSPTDTPSSSLIPQSSELRSDGLALIWNLALPDRPEHIFCCGSPVLTTAFHPTETRLVIGGCHSGQVVVWDVRAGRLPVQRSVGPAGGGHAHPICSMEVVEAGVSTWSLGFSFPVGYLCCCLLLYI